MLLWQQHCQCCRRAFGFQILWLSFSYFLWLITYWKILNTLKMTSTWPALNNLWWSGMFIFKKYNYDTAKLSEHYLCCLKQINGAFNVCTVALHNELWISFIQIMFDQPGCSVWIFNSSCMRYVNFKDNFVNSNRSYIIKDT